MFFDLVDNFMDKHELNFLAGLFRYRYFSSYHHPSYNFDALISKLQLRIRTASIESLSCSDSDRHSQHLWRSETKKSHTFLSTFPSISGLPLIRVGMSMIGDAEEFFLLAIYFFKKGSHTVFSFNWGYLFSNYLAALLDPCCSAHFTTTSSVYFLYFARLLDIRVFL